MYAPEIKTIWEVYIPLCCSHWPEMERFELSLNLKIIASLLSSSLLLLVNFNRLPPMPIKVDL